MGNPRAPHPLYETLGWLIDKVHVYPSTSILIHISVCTLTASATPTNVLTFSLTVEPLDRYSGHTALVTRIIAMDGLLISASWDR